jgi:hypothetical protein
VLLLATPLCKGGQEVLPEPGFLVLYPESHRAYKEVVLALHPIVNRDQSGVDEYGLVRHVRTHSVHETDANVLRIVILAPTEVLAVSYSESELFLVLRSLGGAHELT